MMNQTWNADNSGTAEMQRKDDKSKKTSFRSNRMFEDDGKWYCKTREGGAIGPFRDELEASTQLELYIRMSECGLLAEKSATIAEVKNAV